MSGTAPTGATELEKGLGHRIQAARQKAGITQQQLCQKAGLSYSTLAKIERGAIKAPSVFTIQQLASVLQVPLEVLIGQAPSLPAHTKKRAKSGVTFVFFDINGCLVRFFHRAFTKLSEDTGITPDIIETAFWHYNNAVCKGEMSMEEFNSAIAQKIGIDSLDWGNYYLEAVDPIPEMHDLVTWAAANYDIGLMSNIMPGMIEALTAKGLLPALPYTAVVDSSQVGAIKPEAKIYEIAQKMADRPPSEILLVDDSRTNLMPAEHLGWHVLWFDDYDVAESTKRVKMALAD